jgi:hypothetical protein
MQSASDLLGLAGGKPKLITRYTSGTGTYVPTADMARCLVRIQAGGAGGAGTNYGGGGGAMTEWMLRISIAGLAYVVGAGGAVNSNGSVSSFGQYIALPGTYGNGSSPGVGGPIAFIEGQVDADGVSGFFPGCAGVAGGAGGYGGGSNGFRVGKPINALAAYTGGAANDNINQYSGTFWANGQGNGSGGDSFFGKGGTTGNSPAAGNYGAGGGVNAAGLGGCIEIWDFGA